MTLGTVLLILGGWSVASLVLAWAFSRLKRRESRHWDALVMRLKRGNRHA